MPTGKKKTKPLCPGLNPRISKIPGFVWGLSFTHPLLRGFPFTNPLKRAISALEKNIQKNAFIETTAYSDREKHKFRN